MEMRAVWKRLYRQHDAGVPLPLLSSLALPCSVFGPVLLSFRSFTFNYDLHFLFFFFSIFFLSGFVFSSYSSLFFFIYHLFIFFYRSTSMYRQSVILSPFPLFSNLLPVSSFIPVRYLLSFCLLLPFHPPLSALLLSSLVAHSLVTHTSGFTRIPPPPSTSAKLPHHRASLLLQLSCSVTHKFITTPSTLSSPYHVRLVNSPLLVNNSSLPSAIPVHHYIYFITLLRVGVTVRTQILCRGLCLQNRPPHNHDYKFVILTA